ncbi:MAG: hypothetical protein U9Q04_05720 [Campylobacterota bacterium]|nr:hypothetical protein [Campylobacterota bacterium]
MSIEVTKNHHNSLLNFYKINLYTTFNDTQINDILSDITNIINKDDSRRAGKNAKAQALITSTIF